jgi:hypothetical protein
MFRKTRQAGLPQEAIRDMLNFLLSVLSVPSSSDSPIRPLYLSFRDFLVHPEDAPSTCAITLNKTLLRRFWKSGEVGNDDCLHQIVDVKKLAESDKKLRSTLSKVLLSENREGTNEDRTTCLHSLLEDDSPFTMENAGKFIDTFLRLIELCPEKVMEVFNRECYTPLHKAIQLYKSDNFDFRLLNNVIRELLQRSPKSIFTRVRGSPEKKEVYDKSPYMLLKDLAPQTNSSNKGSKGNKVQCHEEIVRVIKHRCIGGNGTRAEKLANLYGELENGTSPEHHRRGFDNFKPV